MNNKNLIIGIVLAIVLVIGGFFVLNLNQKEKVDEAKVVSEDKIPTISPEEIGLVLSTSSDGKQVIMEINKTEDLEIIEYELSYTSKGDIPRGVIGQIEVEEQGEPLKPDPIDLGTCSSGVCKYDEDVSNLKLFLKVTKTDGSISQLTETLEV